MADEKTEAPQGSSQEGQKPEVRVIDLHELLGEAREAVLLHGGERYRLRITAKDKLILTK